MDRSISLIGFKARPNDKMGFIGVLTAAIYGQNPVAARDFGKIQRNSFAVGNFTF
jgi:hypothetical protein